jgi:hypothetical protein
VIDIGIRLALPFVRIVIEMPHHIFMYLPLQVYADCAIDPNNFVGAYSSVSRNVAAWVRNPNIIRDISNLMMSPFESGRHESLNEIPRGRSLCVRYRSQKEEKYERFTKMHVEIGHRSREVCSQKSLVRMTLHFPHRNHAPMRHFTHRVLKLNGGVVD